MVRRSSLLAILLVAACAHQPARDEATRRYTVLMSTNKAGTQVVTTRGDETTVDYEFNDRGRGPKTHTVVRTDALLSTRTPLRRTSRRNDDHAISPSSTASAR